MGQIQTTFHTVMLIPRDRESFLHQNWAQVYTTDTEEAQTMKRIAERILSQRLLNVSYILVHRHFKVFFFNCVLNKSQFYEAVKGSFSVD